MTVAWIKALTACCSILLTTAAVAKSSAEKTNNDYPAIVWDALQLLPKKFQVAKGQFVMVSDVDAQFPNASPLDRARMRESAMFTYSLGPAGIVYVNEQSAFFRAAEEANRRYGRQSPFKYAIAALIAHEFCHLRKAGTYTGNRADTCYATELSVFLSFVRRGYLDHAVVWAEAHVAALKAAIVEEQVLAGSP